MAKGKCVDRRVTLNLKRLKQLLTTKLSGSTAATEKFLEQLIGNGAEKSATKPVHIPRRVWKMCGQILAEQAYVVLWRKKNGVMVLRNAKVKAHFNLSRPDVQAKLRAQREKGSSAPQPAASSAGGSSPS